MGPFCFVKFEARMKQILIQIEDAAYEQFMGMLALCPQVEVVGECEMVDVLNERDVCMKYALDTLYNNGVFKHLFDYTWIMMCINQGMVDDFEKFKSIEAFRDYLKALGVKRRPCRALMSRAYSWVFDKYPDWTFVDVDDPGEILRRKNVVKQFLSAYSKAKRAKVDRKVDK